MTDAKPEDPFVALLDAIAVMEKDARTNRRWSSEERRLVWGAREGAVLARRATPDDRELHDAIDRVVQFAMLAEIDRGGDERLDHGLKQDARAIRRASLAYNFPKDRPG